jgi:3-dehydroquinate synthase
LDDAHAVIITDANVDDLYAEPVANALAEQGCEVDLLIIDAGEHSKSIEVAAELWDRMLEEGTDRKSTVVAVGGGVVGDLAGFAASVVRRGIDFVQVPTTLLAQVDSSVGGKTGINTAHGKNLIGAFHQPILVIADTALLDTLPEREFRAGYAEVVKYGLLGDAEFFEWLETNWRDVFKGGPARGNAAAPREYAVRKSVEAKAEIVRRDERETGDRMLLNLGHTFGHAFEAAAGFSDRLLHGEAIGLGMALAFEFSARRGLIPEAQADRVIRHLAAVGLPTRIQDVPGEPFSLDTLMNLVAQDKKVKRGALTFILVRGIGASFIARDVEASDVRAFLSDKLAGA